MAKRILIYTNHFYPEQFKINEIVDWICSDDFDVRVITCIPNYPDGNFFKKYTYNLRFTNYNNLIINRLPLIPRLSGTKFMLSLNYITYFISCLIFTIYIAVFKKKYDIIFVHHTSPFLIAINPILYSIFHRRTKKFLWDLDLWPESLEAIGIIKSKLILNLIKNLVKYIYSYYDKILIGSNNFKKIIAKRFDKEIIYFPNWAEKEIENNITIPKIKVDLPENKFVVMYTGNIGKAQNLISLLKTINLLKNDNIYWTFIGGGRYKELFIKKLRNARLIDNCRFIEHIPVKKIPSYVKYANALFLSLSNEKIFYNTVPAKLQSYMAMGKPIIGVMNGEGADIIKKSQCGFVIENYDYTELASKIRDLSKMSSDELDKFGLNGKNFYEKNFNVEMRRNQIIKILS